MSFDVFQAACAAVLAVTYAVVIATTPRGRRAAAAAELALLAVAAWVGEATCIARYEMYRYAPGWWAFLGDVPLLIPLIWPLVVTSARAVAERLWPDDGRGARAVRVGVIVTVDASLMEIVAVAGGLWRWSEGGYLDVPLIGVLGWGFFAGAAVAWLDWARGARGAWRWALPVVAVGATHVLLVMAWWGGLRWGLRGALPPWPALAVFAALMLAAAIVVWRARARGRRLDGTTTATRVLAASVFFALLASLDGATVPVLWAHVGVVGGTYLLAVGWGRARSRQR